MVALALGVLFFGYTIFYFGLSQVGGSNVGLLDVLLPSHRTKLTAKKAA